MVNSNPETVSTDYDTSARLYFEPVSTEDVLAVCESEQPAGVICQFGGQTPLRLAHDLERAGFRVLGTSPAAIDLAEDRAKFAEVLRELEIPAPAHGEARDPVEARAVAREIGFPVVVRPSYVLGGRAMEIVYEEDGARAVRGRRAAAASPDHPDPDRSVPRGGDRDRRRRGLRRHGRVRRRGDGAHRGGGRAFGRLVLSDTAGHAVRRRAGRGRADHDGALARRLGVRGLINLQLASKDERIWVLEANPRASRTVPFVSKVTGVPLAKVATHVLLGRTLARARGRGHDPDRTPTTTCDCRTRRSRRPCSRSAGSPASTRCSVPRCVRRGRSWGSTSIRAGRSRRRSVRAAPRSRARARCSSRSRTATSARSCIRANASPTSGSGCSRRGGPPPCSSARGSRSLESRRCPNTGVRSST